MFPYLKHPNFHIHMTNIKQSTTSFCYLTSIIIITDLYTKEFQKKGLPHCHMLLWVNSSSKIWNAEDVNTYITAEFPDPVTEPALYKNNYYMHDSWSMWSTKQKCSMYEGWKM